MRRPSSFSYVALSLLLVAVRSRASGVLEKCPDLSGAFHYPGHAGLTSICERNWEGRQDMPLPGPGGYYESAVNPHRFVVEQQACQVLRFYGKRTVALQTEELVYADIDSTVIVDLTPAKDRKVTWGESSLTWRQRYTPAGFRFPPWRKEWMELRLEKRTDGSLDYYLRQEGPHGRLIGEMHCVLPPAR